MDMKVSVLLLLLLAATWTGSQGMSLLSRPNLDCCSEMAKRPRIREDRIQGYQYTNPSCTLKAVLVKMEGNKMACVDPEGKWFKKYQRKQKKPNSTST
ncbi:C-C motif chemokine [Turdus rufiventris]|nr:C-C motif chemokine [Turdus rufiventris]